MKNLISAVVCAGLASLLGCGGEDSGSLDAESVEASEAAASAAIFMTTVRVNNVNTNCQVIAGDVLKLGGWTPTTPIAVIACTMPQLIEGQPWDTTRLREIVYNHPSTVSDKIGCTIEWRYKSTGAYAGGSPWLESYVNSAGHKVAGAQYNTTGTNFVSSYSPLSFTWQMLCRIPYGAYLYSYTYSYEDTL